MSISQEIGERLGVLASRAAQEHYMANASKDEYLLPVEAINDAADVVNALNGVSPLSALRNIDPCTRIAVQEFANVWYTEENQINGLLELPWNELCLRNESWQTLHNAAQHCLSEIGFDLAKWERDEGYVA